MARGAWSTWRRAANRVPGASVIPARFGAAGSRSRCSRAVTEAHPVPAWKVAESVAAEAGCPSLGAFVREWLGISPAKGEALVRLERAGQIAPALGDAYRSGTLSWAKAQCLVPLATREEAAPWHAAWVAHAERVSVRRLGDEVSRALVLGRFEPPPLDLPTGSWDDGSAEGAEGDPSSEGRSPRCSGASSGSTPAPRARARRSTSCSSTPSRLGARQRREADARSRSWALRA